MKGFMAGSFRDLKAAALRAPEAHSPRRNKKRKGALRTTLRRALDAASILLCNLIGIR
jgi:hypothetical protein